MNYPSAKFLDLSKQIENLGDLPKDIPADTVVVTGFAELTPLGNTRETAENEFKGINGVKSYDAKNFRTNIAAPVDFKPEEHFSEKELRGMSRVGAMAVFLAREAGRNAKLLDENGKLTSEIDPQKTGCTISSGIGASCNSVDIYEKIHWKGDVNSHIDLIDPVEGSRFVSPFAGLKIFPEEIGGDVESSLGLKGWGVNSAEACATGLSSVVDAYHLIKTGKDDIVFAGGVEDTLTEHPDIGIGVFAAMRGPLSMRNDNPKKASRPFDKDRDGFVLGAGGGVIVLERLESAKKRKAKIYGVLLGAEKGSDGEDPTNLNRKRVAQLILKTVLSPKKKNHSYPIDSIFAHATSTKSGDAAEIETLKLAFGDNLSKIPITAIKSMHGHMAGGAGSANIISALRALNNNFMPPIVNLENPDEAFQGLNFVRGKALEKKFQTALVLAYGFHGKDAVVLLGKYKN